MASYYATAFVTSPVSRHLVAGAGSFKNICIDGRKSPQGAVDIAREVFKKEMGNDYRGFALQKTMRAWDYTSPVVVDNEIPADSVLFLL